MIVEAIHIILSFLFSLFLVFSLFVLAVAGIIAFHIRYRS